MARIMVVVKRSVTLFLPLAAVVFILIGVGTSAMAWDSRGSQGWMKEFFFPVPQPECVPVDDPGGRSLPGDLAIDDRARRLYLVDEGQGKLLVYSTDLVLQETWPAAKADYVFHGPLFGVGLGPEGEPVYVSEGSNLWALSRDGQLLNQISLPAVSGKLPRPLVMANDVCTTPDGAIWITDSRSHQIAGFSGDGKLAQIVDASARMGTLGAILCTSRGTLLVADPLQARIFELHPEDEIIEPRRGYRFTDRWYGQYSMYWTDWSHGNDAGLMSVDALVEADNLILVSDEGLLRYFLPLDRRKDWDPVWLGFLFPSADQAIVRAWPASHSAGNPKAFCSGFSSGVVIDPRSKTIYYSRMNGRALCRFSLPW